MREKIRSASRTLREEGLTSFWGAVIRNFYSLENLLLYRRCWDATVAVPRVEHMHIFMADKEYLPVLVNNWPDEFTRMIRNLSLLENLLLKRWASGSRCFVAERNGCFCGSLWAESWQYGYEHALGGNAGQIFEYVNVFVGIGARGLGVGRSLLGFAGTYMARQGRPIGIGRVRADRLSSMAMFEKSGFERMGLISSGLVMGKTYVRLRLGA